MSQIRTSQQELARSDELYRRVLDVYEGLGYPASVVNSWAISPNDVPDLISVAQRARPKTILEVGTYVGVSTMILALACPEAKIVTVDPDLSLKTEMDVTGSSLADVDPETTTLTIARAVAEKLRIADRIQFVKGGFSVKDTFSTALTSGGSATKIVGPRVCKENGPFDFVFIDGLHTLNAVANDLKLASKHLAPGGAIALHDCVGFWGANVRGGIQEFLRSDAGFRFVHPPFADLWRTLGVVAPAGSKLLQASDFSKPLSVESRPVALSETLSVMVQTVFGERSALEVAIGAPVLTGVNQTSVRVLSGRAANNLNAELDRILGQFDKLENPVIFSSDFLDFAPAALVQNLLTAIAFRKTAMLLGITPPGEAGVAGPESKPAAWLVDMAKSHQLAAYAPSGIEFEPARYGLFAEERELGGNSRLATFVLIAPKGGFIDAKGRALVELTSDLATEREQAELQRVHVAAGFRKFFSECASAGRALSEQNDRFQSQIAEALEAAQREKAWREENTESLSRQIKTAVEAVEAERQRFSQLQSVATEKAAQVEVLSAQLRQAMEGAQRGSQLEAQLVAEVADSGRALADVSGQLRAALEAGHREKMWREEAAESHLQQIAALTARVGSLEAEAASTAEELRAAERRQTILKANAEATKSFNLLETEASDLRERNLRKALGQFMEHERISAEALAQLETMSRDRIGALEGEVERLRSQAGEHERVSAEALALFETMSQDRIAALEGEVQRLSLQAGTLENDCRKQVVELDAAQEENARVMALLADQENALQDYSQRLLDAYRAMDGFDALAQLGEGVLVGLGATGTPPALPADGVHDLDAWSTSAQMESLRHRLQVITEGLVESVADRETRSQEATTQLADYSAQIAVRDAQARQLQAEIAELKEQLTTTSVKERTSVHEQIVAAEKHSLDTSLHLAEIYGVLEQLDQANLQHLRLLGDTSPPAVSSGEPQDLLWALSDRSRRLSDVLSEAVSSRHAQTTGPGVCALITSTQAEELTREVARLQRENEDILGSTTWRATAPIRRTGSVLAKVKRKVGARRRLKAFALAKEALDAKLAPSGLIFPAFDVEAYTRADKAIPLEKGWLHYVEFGEREGRRPLSNFDPHFYVAAYPDVRTSRVSPLLHFMMHGVHEGRSPCARLHPLGELAQSKGMSPLEFFARS